MNFSLFINDFFTCWLKVLIGEVTLSIGLLNSTKDEETSNNYWRNNKKPPHQIFAEFIRERSRNTSKSTKMNFLQQLLEEIKNYPENETIVEEIKKKLTKQDVEVNELDFLFHLKTKQTSNGVLSPTGEFLIAFQDFIEFHLLDSKGKSESGSDTLEESFEVKETSSSTSGGLTKSMSSVEVSSNPPLQDPLQYSKNRNIANSDQSVNPGKLTLLSSHDPLHFSANRSASQPDQSLNTVKNPPTDPLQSKSASRASLPAVQSNICTTSYSIFSSAQLEQRFILLRNELLFEKFLRKQVLFFNFFLIFNLINTQIYSIL